MSSESTKDNVSTPPSVTHSLRKYTLIVTEKPDAAKKVAYALDRQEKPKHLKKNGVTYFVAQRDRQLVVVPALGHLYTIVQNKGKRNYYPIFNFRWAPRHLVERRAKSISNWIETFSELSRDADEFISACDYDIEGSLIAYFILKYACGNKESIAKRMKFSTLMKNELEKAYEEPLSHLDFTLIEAGRIRHEVDWLYGVNLSRALTLAAYRWSGKNYTLSTGRVQGPTLQFLTEREKVIRSFVPVPYWEIHAKVEILNSVVDADYEKKRIETSLEADAIVQACENKTGEIKKVDVKNIQQKPPIPFDVGTLQREAYSLFGYTPRRTLAIAQRLYLDALISYPRTSSQKLPPIIDYRKILCSLKGQSGYKLLASKLLKKEVLKPLEGTKKDPAHPAVYPTGNLPGKLLKAPEKRIWDLIIRRFMAVFGDDALKEILKARLDVKRHSFFVRGRRLLSEGWMQYYKPYVRIEDVVLPPFNEGDKVRLRRIIRKDKFTCPPPRYNPGSILKKMEELRIGTKSTRANIIQTLHNRKYIRDERIIVTELGFDIIDVLGKYAPIVVSIQLTQEIENKMEKIQDGSLKREAVLAGVAEQLRPQLEQFKENEETIGESLSKATRRVQIPEQVVGRCPTCITGNLAIIRSRSTRKRFIGCTNYFRGVCETSFPLPQRGTVKPTRSRCEACGWPQVLVWLRARKPWNLCFNPNCFLKNVRRKN